ncbi:predicted protein [Sclerotinia sclerotiorum 1980 UF-70]|uniref:Uncharacterized protein n=2 Tax=Sclerotinia sclerotiorum (strain ATCC 18683 / 1980 / Ss-1) TaxID=665079 RepID=A7EUB0_SCLS1|nr:predicted protein [Sclerotinia sclerotiorum 1980 UF-70]APA15282.1 hypothetical protein sscle_14g100520 [Sclerotinia sclerotiorum 1980 UF-70]EDN93052.1 predicted protein [Sclerotinia sclerotiorum 1980 UF-70]
MRLSQALVLAASAPFAIAYPKFAAPAAGAVETAGTAFTVTWADSGDAPSIADISTYSLAVCAGSSSGADIKVITTVSATVSMGSTLTTTVTVPATSGESVTNAYFMRMIATAKAGGTVTVYSDRFSISGMTGTFGATFTITGTAGPATVNTVANTVADTTAASSSTLAEGVYGIPFQSQTGPTRYAPMGLMPGSSITATNTAPQYPTSSVSLATTYLSSATIATTLTQAQTASFESHANTVAAASMPTDDMAKFLARWKD